MPAVNTTKTKILNAAELLFAQSGFAETSMRAITNKAGVNLAAVNYHFGSKKALTIAVLDRYMKQLMPELASALSQIALHSKTPDVSEVFKSFVTPLIRLESINKGGTVCFLNLLGRGYIEVQGHLKRYILETYEKELETIKQTLHSSCPFLTEEELFWRLHFTLGTSVFTLAASEALIGISQADFGQPIDTESILERILPYIGAGFSANLKS